MRSPEDESGRPRRRLLVAIAVAVVLAAFIIVHLTGLVGPASH